VVTILFLGYSGATAVALTGFVLAQWRQEKADISPTIFLIWSTRKVFVGHSCRCEFTREVSVSTPRGTDCCYSSLYGAP